MTKQLKRTIALAAGMLFIFSALPALAQDAELEQLKQQIQQLVSQNQRLINENKQLNSRMSKIEQAMESGTVTTDSGQTASSPVPTELLRTKEHQVIRKEMRQEMEEETPVEISSSPVPEKLLRTKVHQAVRKEMRKEIEEEGNEQKINKYVTLFGLIEFEGVVGNDFADNSVSEFNVATGQLGFDAQLSDWTVGHLLALYEGPDDDTLTIDEANIWLGNYEKFPALLTAGKFYMPFGKFETNMVQDPLTLNLGEMNDYGVAAGFKKSGFLATAYAYNGMKEKENENTIRGYGASIGFDYSRDDFSLNAGLCWVNNMADADSISDVYDEMGLETIHDPINGFGLHLLTGYGPISFIGEYIEALDQFYEGAFNPETGEMEGGEILYMGHGAEPKAWNTELAWSTELFGKSTVFAVSYQGSEESVELSLPSSRYMGIGSMVVLPGTTISIEYFHDRDYDLDEGGTGESADIVTTQLAYEF
jgi:hypothetical protein